MKSIWKSGETLIILPKTAHRLSVIIYGVMQMGVLFRQFTRPNKGVDLKGFVHTSRSMLLLGLVFLTGMMLNSIRRCTHHTNGYAVVLTVMFSMVVLFLARLYAITRLKRDNGVVNRKYAVSLSASLVGFLLVHVFSLWSYGC